MKAIPVFAGLMLLCACSARADDIPPLRLVTIVNPDLPAYKIFTDFADAAFKKLKIPYTLTYNPGERAAMAFKTGQFDGDIARARSFVKTYPEALRIDPPLFTADYIGISKSDAISPAAWHELSQYRIAYRRGFKSIDAYTANVAQKTLVDSNESCVRMVRDDVVDVCVGVLAGFKNLMPLDKQFRIGNLGQSKIHVWLAPQHKGLAEALGQVITDMQKRGDLEQFFKDFN